MAHVPTGLCALTYKQHSVHGLLSYPLGLGLKASWPRWPRANTQPVTVCMGPLRIGPLQGTKLCTCIAGLATRATSPVSPIMSCLQYNKALGIGSEKGDMQCPSSKAALSGPDSCALTIGAPFAALGLAVMSFFRRLTAPITGASRLNMNLDTLTCFVMLRTSAYLQVAQISNCCWPLPHSHSANGTDMNPDPSL